jgi:hypothetical protein
MSDPLPAEATRSATSSITRRARGRRRGGPAQLLSLTLVRLGLDVDTAESVAVARAMLSRNATRCA